MLSTMIKKWRGERPTIFILSGAGLSVESGIPAYRGEGTDPGNDSADLSSTYMRLMPKRVYEAANKRIRDFDAKKRGIRQYFIFMATSTVVFVSNVVRFSPEKVFISWEMFVPRVVQLVLQ